MSRRGGVGRNRRQKPVTAAQKLAKVYRCGHCRSEVRGIHRDADGIEHLDVRHDGGCPVLSGAVADTGDVFRAATRAGVAMLAVKVADGGAE
ncbi:hypothetical protein GCM10009837_58580 [Streptomyces durmitorensis]